MEDKYKVKSLVFVLDTNVLIHCKNFTQIQWDKIFEEDCEKILILIPYMVLKELDNLKYQNKNALKAINKIRDIETGKFQVKAFGLISSILPPNWDKLLELDKQKLSMDEADHQILAEILLYHQENPQSKVVFVTGDYLPSKLAKEIKIECLYWLDENFRIYFEKEKISTSKLEPLEIYFTEEEKCSKEIILNKTIVPQKPLRLEDYEKDFSRPTNHPLISHKRKEDFQRELVDYNNKMKELCRYVEIQYALQNHSNTPITNIDVYIQMELEKGFKVKYSHDIEFLERPKIIGNITSLRTIFTPHSILKEPNVKYNEIIHIERDRNDVWIIQNRVGKIKHNETEFLYPFMLWIPEYSSTEKIIIQVSFTQDQEGKINDQKLSIILV